MSAVLQRFREKLPHKPYYANDFMYGVRTLPKDIATLTRFIQQDQPHALYWLPFDVDRIEASIGWSDRNCPAPNITVENSRGGYAHLLYALALPVRIAPDTSASALRCATAIERALYEKLDANVNYSGLICKNPCYPKWQEVEWHGEPYTLDELTDYLDLSASACHSVDKNYGLGRNYHLLEKVRKWAYRAIRQGWSVFSQWLDAVIQCIEMYNVSLPVPLSPAECRTIGKSIVKYTRRKFLPERFPTVQTARGRKGGTKSERAAVPTSARLLRPWEALGISRATYYRKLECDPDFAK